MARKINIRPTSGVYATYKRLSYQPWTAIAEFVDNSTQSFYDHKAELMAIKYAKGLRVTINYIEDAVNGDRLEIVDDAFGMEWHDFQRAVILDRPPQNTNGRNEFGMGLKTAACWFGSLWSVESTQLNSRMKYYAEIDVDNLGKYKTEEIEVKEDFVSAKEHGTKIVIRNLNKKIVGPRTIGKVRELLSSIYREDIRSGLVQIFYNGTLLQYKEAPVFEETVDGQTKVWKKEIQFSVNYGEKLLGVRGFVAIRIPGSLKEGGFTLLRRGRVIVGGPNENYRPNELFGDANSYTWQRMYGELHMDDWPVTQAKDGFDWHNSGLEEAFIEQLETITQDYRRKAESIRVRERINTQEIARTTAEGLSQSGGLENVKAQVVNSPASGLPTPKPEQNAQQASDTEEQEVQINSENDDGVSLEGGEQLDVSFTRKGIDYLFHTVLDTGHPSFDWLTVEPISEREYMLTINMRHAFFRPLIDKKEFLPIMVKMSVALVLAEVEAQAMSPYPEKIDPHAIRIIMNDILETVQRS